ncbi:hypothetical protein [Pseudomonas sp. 3-2]|uniref:hypothetical protein n=1 Tax=Pseudomonas sp. 3-2 TaxID=2867408 RepID=UPI001C87E160|nr:hypothetical protein [Pseudomonas sp. 3-2]QZD73224.1 hypothetical protein K3819_10305 [Pseudomonas sp. 3-2]
MRTLDSWAHRLLHLPLLIECPLMQVIGYDQEEPSFTGPGHISIKSRTEMEFVMHGTPADEAKALERVMLAFENPYVNLDQLRVFAVDYEGVEWNCGWVDVQIGETAKGTWRLSGNIQGIMTMASGTRIHPEPGVEVIYDAQLSIPIPLLSRKALRENAESPKSTSRQRIAQQHQIEVEGGRVAFHRSWGDERLWITASGFQPCFSVFLENWVGEPLNLLFGQLIHPRLTARNMGDGSALIALRNVSDHTADAQVSSLLIAKDQRWHSERFWELYGQILSMIIRAGQNKAAPDLALHQLTQYYQEIAQATTGSHWVLCMTLASVIEGVANLMFPPVRSVISGKENIDTWEASIRSLEVHVQEWEGDNKLRQRLMTSLRGARDKGVLHRLKSLVENGVIDKEHLNVWQKVRNSVMHGNLVSPWLTEELEQKLTRLTELAHRLSEAYIRKCAA